MCFTLSRAGRAILEFKFAFRYKAGCAGLQTSGSFGFVAPVAVGPDGAFRGKSGASAVDIELDFSGTSVTVTARPAAGTKAGTVDIAGKVSGAKAGGTLRLKLQLATAIDKTTGKQRPVSCDTGRLGWTAKRVA